MYVEMSFHCTCRHKQIGIAVRIPTNVHTTQIMEAIQKESVHNGKQYRSLVYLFNIV